MYCNIHWFIVCVDVTIDRIGQTVYCYVVMAGIMVGSNGFATIFIHCLCACQRGAEKGWLNPIGYILHEHFDGLMLNCSISNAWAMEILQSCIKPSIYRDQSVDNHHFVCVLGWIDMYGLRWREWMRFNATLRLSLSIIFSLLWCVGEWRPYHTLNTEEKWHLELLGESVA